MPLPRIDTFSALDHYLIERADTFAAERDDVDHQTAEARERALGKVAIISELRVVIARKVADELLSALVDKPERADDAPPLTGLQRTEAAARRLERLYRARYGDDPMAPWQAEGR